MRVLVLLILLFSGVLHAHEIQSTTQHVNIRRTDQSGWLQEIGAKINVNSKFDVGALASYLERFDLFEKRLGGLVAYRPDKKWTFEARYLQGHGNEILPEKQTILSAYYAFGKGLSPFLYYQDARYSITTLHTFNAGLEIEKIANFIFIPTIMMGRATFKSPGKTDDLYSYGLRAVYYVEKKYSFSAWGFKGREASQGIIGRSTQLVDTLSGGVSAGLWLSENFKSELLFDHTDYDQLKQNFIQRV